MVATRDPPTAPMGLQTVHVVDDDEGLRGALLDYLALLGMRAEGYAATSDFLRGTSSSVGGCMLLDLNLSGSNGIEFQEELKSLGYDLPIIFMTAYGDVSSSVFGMKRGAIDFLQKPFRSNQFLAVIHAALALDRERQGPRMLRHGLQDRAASLTPREYEVVKLVVTGMMNKDVAKELGISEIMVKLHRGRAMRKMQASSLPDLVRKVQALAR